MRTSGRWWPRLSSAGVLAVLAVATFAGLRPTPPEAVAARGAAPAPPASSDVAAPIAGPILAPYAARQVIASSGAVAYVLAGGALTLEDIPVPALVAYQRAATAIDAADSRCHLDWELLAALGKVVSDHGRTNGSAFDELGVSRPAVLGQRLTGRHRTQRVIDTDRGALDRDSRFDRAVGPMLLLPAVWSTVAVDGDSDGKRNPQDIDDAALGAAVFLCAGPGDFRNASHVREEVKRYHPGADYAKHVLGVRGAYRDAGTLVSNISVLAREEGVSTADLDALATTPTLTGDEVFHPGPPTWSPGTSDGPSTSPSTSPSSSPTPTPTSTPTPTTTPSDSGEPTPSTDPSPSSSDDPSSTVSPSESPTVEPTETATPTDEPGVDPDEPTGGNGFAGIRRDRHTGAGPGVLAATPSPAVQSRRLASPEWWETARRGLTATPTTGTTGRSRPCSRPRPAGW